MRTACQPSADTADNMPLSTTKHIFNLRFVAAVALMSISVANPSVRAEDFRHAVKQAVPRLVNLRTLSKSDPTPGSEEEDATASPDDDAIPSPSLAYHYRMGLIIGDRLIGSIESAQGELWQLEQADGSWIDIPMAGHDQLTGIVILRDTRSNAPEFPPLTEGETELALPVVVTWLVDGIPQAISTIVTCNGSAQMRGMASIHSLDSPSELGAPILSANGELLGLATQIRIASAWRPKMPVAGVGGYPLTLEDQSQVVNLIAPIATIHRLVEEISQHDEPVILKYGYMGIRVDTETGLIESVIPEGPAEKIGIQSGDRIAKIGGQEVSAQQRIFSILQHYRAGDTVSLLVKREKEDLPEENLELELTLVAMDMSQLAAAVPAPDESEGNGLTLRKIDRTTESADDQTDATADSSSNIGVLQKQMQKRLNQYPPEIIVERTDVEELIRELRKEIEALRAELRERK